jgi:hypothetical protein
VNSSLHSNDLAGSVKLKCFKVVYFFAGAKRKNSLANILLDLGRGGDIFYDITEVDILRDPADDLLPSSARKLWLDRLKAEEFQVIIVTPPCNSWSRLVWLNNFGPKPCRSRNHPRGFPWADKGSVSRRHAEEGNIWVDFLIAVLVIVRDLNNDRRFTLVLAEHPEDLGFSEDIRPASIWQLLDLRESAAGWCGTCAIYQCLHCSHEELVHRDFAKPTRFVSNSKAVLALGHAGWPTLSASGAYQGPLPSTCGHRHNGSLVRKRDDSAFRSSGSSLTQNFWTRSSHTRCTRIYYAPYYFALYRWLGPRRASLWSPRRGRWLPFALAALSRPWSPRR